MPPSKSKGKRPDKSSHRSHRTTSDEREELLDDEVYYPPQSSAQAQEAYDPAAPRTPYPPESGSLGTQVEPEYPSTYDQSQYDDTAWSAQVAYRPNLSSSSGYAQSTAAAGDTYYTDANYTTDPGLNTASLGGGNEEEAFAQSYSRAEEKLPERPTATFYQSNSTLPITQEVDEESEDFAQAAEQSRRYHYSTNRHGESSRSAPSSAQYTPSGEPYGAWPATSSAQVPNSTSLRPPGDNDRFRVERSRKFEPGTVFIVHWTEPHGESQNSYKIPGGTRVTDADSYGSQRRFIVVATDEGHSQCVPILTYRGQACTKHGLKPKKHGIIYSKGAKPKTLKDEPELGFKPVMLTENYGVPERLHKASRVNYSKLVPIEHNVRVRMIGKIVGKDFKVVQNAVNTTWEMMIHEQNENTSNTGYENTPAAYGTGYENTPAAYGTGYENTPAAYGTGYENTPAVYGAAPTSYISNAASGYDGNATSTEYPSNAGTNEGQYTQEDTDDGEATERPRQQRSRSSRTDNNEDEQQASGSREHRSHHRSHGDRKDSKHDSSSRRDKDDRHGGGGGKDSSKKHRSRR